MRINKRMSNYGYCSRKEVNRWIEKKRIRINGELALEGQWTTDLDHIELDGVAIKPQKKRYLIFHKPVGLVCTADLAIQNSVMTYLDLPYYVFPVGRLDKDSEGLLFLTNDGELANQLLDSENGHEKVYEVSVNRAYDEIFIAKMSQGVPIDGKMTKPCILTSMSSCQFKITLSQGLNRQIRKMCAFLGYQVVTLKRVNILNLSLEGLEVGHYRNLTEEELRTLKQILKAV